MLGTIRTAVKQLYEWFARFHDSDVKSAGETGHGGIRRERFLERKAGRHRRAVIGWRNRHIRCARRSARSRAHTGSAACSRGRKAIGAQCARGGFPCARQRRKWRHRSAAPDFESLARACAVRTVPASGCCAVDGLHTASAIDETAHSGTCVANTSRCEVRTGGPVERCSFAAGVHASSPGPNFFGTGHSVSARSSACERGTRQLYTDVRRTPEAGTRRSSARSTGEAV
jgi:hypothetical protein